MKLPDFYCPRVRFSALQRAENSSINCATACASLRSLVSVLFSEPKIPQSPALRDGRAARPSFSALQRAENSSIIPHQELEEWTHAVFQCSSASRKFLNTDEVARVYRRRRFQCSSASRKFLNTDRDAGNAARAHPFQCSSASRKFLNIAPCCQPLNDPVTFQCSSASRKFLNDPPFKNETPARVVSVLFSEPKIPQYNSTEESGLCSSRFSALQRAENSSIVRRQPSRA